MKGKVGKEVGGGSDWLREVKNASCVLSAAPFPSSSTLCSVPLCLLPTVCSGTLCNALQTDLTGWMWTVKYLLLEYYLLRVYKPRSAESGKFRQKKKR